MHDIYLRMVVRVERKFLMELLVGDVWNGEVETW